MTKSQFHKFHARIVKAKAVEDLRSVIGDLLHEEHGEPKESLLALAMANKRIFYNMDLFDSILDAAEKRKLKLK